MKLFLTIVSTAYHESLSVTDWCSRKKICSHRRVHRKHSSVSETENRCESDAEARAIKETGRAREYTHIQNSRRADTSQEYQRIINDIIPLKKIF